MAVHIWAEPYAEPSTVSVYTYVRWGLAVIGAFFDSLVLLLSRLLALARRKRRLRSSDVPTNLKQGINTRGRMTSGGAWATQLVQQLAGLSVGYRRRERPWAAVARALVTRQVVAYG